MKNSIYARLEALEGIAPSNIIILLENAEGVQRTATLSESLNEKGEPLPGFEGFRFVRVLKGNRIKDVDKILKHISEGAEWEDQNREKAEPER